MKSAEANELNKGLPIPLYFQLKGSLLKRITQRQWSPGYKITESQICEMFNVSRITTRKALQDLQDEGYLEKRQGVGTFVRTNLLEQKLCKFYSFSEELRKSGMTERAEVLDFCTIASDETTASSLSIEKGQSAFCIRRIRSVNAKPYAYEVSYIPIQLAPKLTPEMISSQGLYASLAQLGVPVDSAEEKLRAINLDGKTAELLQVHPNEAAMLLTRTAFSGNKAAEYCVSTVRGDFFSYSVELK